MTRRAPVLALSGGVGGAKLAHGLAQTLPGEELTVVCNTGDDFDFLGLRICPDLDSVTYALAGVDDRERGWGRGAETWQFSEALRSFTDAAWFRIGDKDLALHAWRTEQLRKGNTLSSVAIEAARRLGVEAFIVPMSDDTVITLVHSDVGLLSFQEYFVRERAIPRVLHLEYAGADIAAPSAAASQLVQPLRAVIICPSNPWLSIAPLLAIQGWRTALQDTQAPVIAVSPIVGGRALKGPTAKIMRELGIEVSPRGIARHYHDLLDALVIDEIDRHYAPDIEALGIRCAVAQTIMGCDADRAALASRVLALADAFSRP